MSKNAAAKKNPRARGPGGKFVKASEDETTDVQPDTEPTADGATDEQRGADTRMTTAGLDRDRERASWGEMSREAEEIDLSAFEESILNQEQLVAPPAREGFDQRWVAAQVMGGDMPMNYSRQLRMGWRARDPRSVDSTHYPTFEGANGQGFIGHAGLILMERPQKLSDLARKVNRKRVNARTESIRTTLESEEEDGHPIEKEYKTKVELGREAVPAEDDF